MTKTPPHNITVKMFLFLFLHSFHLIAFAYLFHLKRIDMHINKETCAKSRGIDTKITSELDIWSKILLSFKVAMSFTRINMWEQDFFPSLQRKFLNYHVSFPYEV